MPIIWEPFVKFADFVLYHEYVGMYFYSAVFQGNMALIAIFGVFLVFRLQSLDQVIAYSLNETKEFIISRHIYPSSSIVYRPVKKVYSVEVLLSLLSVWLKPNDQNKDQEKFKEEALSLKNDAHFIYLLKNCLALVRFRKEIISSLWQSITPILGIIFYSLILLTFSYSLNHWNKSFEIFLIFGAIGLEFYALQKLYHFVLLTIVHVGDVDTKEIEKHEFFQEMK